MEGEERDRRWRGRWGERICEAGEEGGRGTVRGEARKFISVSEEDRFVQG